MEFPSGSVSLARTLVVIPSFNIFAVPPLTTLITSGFPVGGSFTLVMFTFIISSGEHANHHQKQLGRYLYFHFDFL